MIELPEFIAAVIKTFQQAIKICFKQMKKNKKYQLRNKVSAKKKINKGPNITK